MPSNIRILCLLGSAVAGISALTNLWFIPLAYFQADFLMVFMHLLGVAICITALLYVCVRIAIEFHCDNAGVHITTLFNKQVFLPWNGLKSYSLRSGELAPRKGRPIWLIFIGEFKDQVIAVVRESSNAQILD
jgi:hypothetical protein